MLKNWFTVLDGFMKTLIVVFFIVCVVVMANTLKTMRHLSAHNNCLLLRTVQIAEQNKHLNEKNLQLAEQNNEISKMNKILNTENQIINKHNQELLKRLQELEIIK